MKKDIEDARGQLDEVDAEILRALGDRQSIVARIASLKSGHAGPLRDPSREEELLLRLMRQAGDLGIDHGLVSRVFREILDHSLRSQVDVVQREDRPTEGVARVGFQGGTGAYSQMAARRHFAGREIHTQGYATFRAMLDGVAAGEVDCALLPIENTTAGSINDAYDQLARTRLAAVGEEILAVDHCLVALEAIDTRDLRRIASHPQALAQCSELLATMSYCEFISYPDTALAVEKVRRDGDRRQAAIASAEAARRCGLVVLDRGVANQPENYTRFLVVAREAVAVDARIPAKTSIILTTRHEQGALGACLTILADHGLNLTKLESRPRRNTPWEYLFYLDFEGNVAAEPVRDALRSLSAHATSLRVLGSYPARSAALRAVRPRAATGVGARVPVGVGNTGGSGAAPTNGANGANGASSANGASTGNGGRPATNGATTDPRAVRVPQAVLDLLETKSYKLVARTQRLTDSIVHVGKVAFGGADPVLIAGPCSVESEEQILQCAKAVADNGGHVLRGGCYKPRTSPYSFQGMGDEGLLLLAEAGRRHGLPVITEVLRPADADRVAEHADILQIGARNVQNFSLLRAAGETDRPVLLKRGMMSSIDEWLAAAEYILAAGNQQVILCERGIRTFETTTRNTLDLTTLPAVRERTHLPVIVDPSHACGVWRWVTPMVRAALGAGAQGVMVEIHPRPDEALSDGPQSLMFDKFAELATAFREAAR